MPGANLEYGCLQVTALLEDTQGPQGPEAVCFLHLCPWGPSSYKQQVASPMPQLSPSPLHSPAFIPFYLKCPSRTIGVHTQMRLQLQVHTQAHTCVI